MCVFVYMSEFVSMCVCMCLYVFEYFIVFLYACA